MISSSMLILFYTLQQATPNICTKFPNPRRSSSWEIFDTSFPMYYMEWEMEKGNMEREGKNKSQHFGSLFHNILGHSQGV